MRTANNIEQLYPALLEQLAAWKVDMESRPADWRASLGRAIQQGAFIRLHYAIGSAGVIDASIELVAPTGLQSTPLSLVGVEHA